MGRRPCTFKEADVRRALKAARKAGFEVAGFTVDTDGKIAVQVGKPADDELQTAKNDWDSIYDQN
jgi:hypothetical protein